MAAQNRTYFRKLGISEDIVDLMVSTQTGETRILTEPELLKLRLATEVKDGRAVVYGNNGDNDRAIADYDKAIEIDPKYAPAYNGRAMVYFTAGKPAQGLPDVEKSLELRPDYPEALDTRGLIFEALGRKQEAIADFRRALAMAPNRQSSNDALKRLGALGTP